jgi:hypothetical protein
LKLRFGHFMLHKQFAKSHETIERQVWGKKTVWGKSRCGTAALGCRSQREGRPEY